MGPFPLLQLIESIIAYSIKKRRQNFQKSGKKGAWPIGQAPFHIISNTHSTTPYTTLATVPNTITGPATTNILAAMPVTMPSAAVNIGHSDL